MMMNKRLKSIYIHTELMYQLILLNFFKLCSSTKTNVILFDFTFKIKCLSCKVTVEDFLNISWY